MSSRLQFLAVVALLPIAVHISPSMVSFPVGTVPEAVQYAVSGLSPFFGLVTTFTLNHNAHCGSACTTLKAALLSTAAVPCAARVSQCHRFQYKLEPVKLDEYKRAPHNNKYPETCTTARACYQALVHEKGSGEDWLYRGCLEDSHSCKPFPTLIADMNTRKLELTVPDNDFQCCSVDFCNEQWNFNKWNETTKWEHDPTTSTTTTTEAVPTMSSTTQPSSTGPSPNPTNSGSNSHHEHPDTKRRFGTPQIALIGVLAVCTVGMLITGILFCVAMSGKICATVEAPSADVPNKQLDPSML